MHITKLNKGSSELWREAREGSISACNGKIFLERLVRLCYALYYVYATVSSMADMGMSEDVGGIAMHGKSNVD